MLRRRAMLLLLLLLLPASCDATYTYDIQGCVGTARHLYREGDTHQRRSPLSLSLSHTHTAAAPCSCKSDNNRHFLRPPLGDTPLYTFTNECSRSTDRVRLGVDGSYSACTRSMIMPIVNFMLPQISDPSEQRRPTTFVLLPRPHAFLPSRKQSTTSLHLFLSSACLHSRGTA